MTKDIVFGMDVDEKKAKTKTTCKGKIYYFCVPRCQKTFEANPEKYLSGSSGHSDHGCCCSEC